MQSASEARAAAQSRVRLELLANLIRKDLKVKYKNSALGFLWSLANPLLYMVVFYVVFSKILGNGVPNFAVLLMSGLGFAGVHFVLQLAVLFAFMGVFYRDFVGPQLALLPPALAVVLLFTVAMALLASSLNVRFRDMEHLLEVALLAWFWLTPIVYQVALVRQKLAAHGLFWVYMINPVTAVVVAMQRAIYRHPVAYDGNHQPHEILAADGYAFYLKWLGIAALISLALLAVGLWTFRRLQANFAEEL